MRSVVLLSGGLDSGYNLFRAAQETQVLLALTFDYGQRAAASERRAAAAVCSDLGIKHQIIELPWFREFTSTALVGSADLPKGDAVRIDDMKVSQQTMKAVWVPNRNGIFLNVAAGFAEGLGADVVIPGFNAEEAATFPDNSLDYLGALDRAFVFSTNGKVKTHCYSVAMNKTEIVREAVKIGVPLKKLWPCYEPGEVRCGECESCQRFDRALRSAGVVL